MKVLIATDGSEHASATVELIAQLPLPTATTVAALSVVYSEDAVAVSIPFDPLNRNDRRYELIADEANRAAVGFIEAAAERLQSADRQLVGLLRFGHLADEVVRAAQETDADLLVVGSRGLGAFRGWLLGSVSQSVVATAPCSVLVVRPRSAVNLHDPLRVLLATDGSDHAVFATDVLSRLQLGEHATLNVLTVCHPVTSSGFAMAVLSGQCAGDELAAARLFVEGVAESLRALGAEVTGMVRSGTPADEIMAAAQEWQADLIVVGARGHSALERFLLGSVSQKLATYAPCSVLIARPRA